MVWNEALNVNMSNAEVVCSKYLFFGLVVVWSVAGWEYAVGRCGARDDDEDNSLNQVGKCSSTVERDLCETVMRVSVSMMM